MSVQWKQIPLGSLKHFKINEYGEIRYLDTNQIYRQYSYGNNYKYIAIKEGRKLKRFAIHRLVALTFLNIPEDGLFDKYPHPTVDGVPYIVNHIDSVKTNNHYSNLEWCDSKYNSKHSFNNDLNPATYKIQIRDLLTGKITLYNGMSEVGRFLNIKHNVALIIHNYQDIPYLSRYLFKILKVDIRIINKLVDNNKSIYCLNYITQSIIVLDSAVQAEQVTGIVANTIKARCKIMPRDIDIIGGYDFYYLKNIDMNNPPTFRNFSKEYAIKSKERYLLNIENGLTSYMKKVISKNINTGEIRKYNSLKEMSNDIGKDYQKLKSIINNNKARGKKENFIDDLQFDYEENGIYWL